MTIAEMSARPSDTASTPDTAGTDTATPDPATNAGGGDGTPTGGAADPITDRLRLRPARAGDSSPDESGPGQGFVDGGWWPHSDDLTAELPRLITELSDRGYQIRRVTYNLDAWAPAPRRLTVHGRVVKLGGFRSQSPAEIVLVDSGGWQRTELVVVPSHSDPALAERALVLAATLGDQHRAARILELAAD